MNLTFHEAIPSSATLLNNPDCIQCHLVSFVDTQTLDKDHMVLKTSDHGTIITTEITDPYSLACLTCHNGNEAINAPVTLPVCPSSTPELPSNIKNHPVFKPYAGGRSDLRAPGESLPGTWNDAKTVSDLMRNGQIVCISCHVPHISKEKGSLRAPIKGSLLCFGCHKK
ncbi:MAG: cytochrome c3 family protein [Sulfuricurvum sp.]|nr:cytochrome c3 family protein [Sulfuricurvum sp.]